MKIVICWSHISGYMAASWRALAAVPGVDLFVLGFRPDTIAPFDPALLGDVRHTLMDETQRFDPGFVRDLVLAEKPDVLTISGWANVGYRPLAAEPKLAGVTKMMSMDTPLRLDWKQAIGKRLLRRYLRNFDYVVVPGERTYLYARYLGFADRQIRKGVYAIDYAAFEPCLAARVARPGGWPRTFVYAGRYADEKGLDTLVAAYATYRRESADPWELACCGRGPAASVLSGQAGVTDLGFIQPTVQADVFTDAGAFVLASRFDPWPLVVVEAAAAGLPLVCSTACGSPVEVLRDHFNGYTFATGDAAMLARRLHQIAARTDLADWGTRSQVLAAPHAARLWPWRFFDGLLPGDGDAAHAAAAG